jgi:xylulokinase
MLLGVDLGTSSVKAVLLDPDGHIVGEGSAPYEVSRPEPGWAESAPEDWWQGAGAAIRQAITGNGDAVRAVGLSGQMHGVVLTEASGRPVRPAILWPDTRSSRQLDEYRRLDERRRHALANPYVTGMAGPSLLWLREHEPHSYAAARWALQTKDWFRLQLTGEVATDPSDASATLLFDLIRDDWAWDVVETLQLRADLLAPVLPSGSVVGSLRPDMARMLDLPAGIPVATGAGDTAAAALGTGLLVPLTGQLTVGTAGQIIALLDHPEPDPTRRTHLYRAATPGCWYAMAAMQNVGLALEWARTVLGVTWTQVYDEAFTVPAGAGGVSFLPYLTGERTPVLDPDAHGAWVGLSLHHTRAHLLRAALEGVAFALRDGLEALEARGLALPELRLAGGGTVQPNWRAMLADVLQRPLHIVSNPAASARGAALLAGIAVGVYADEPATLDIAPAIEQTIYPGTQSARYEDAYRRYQSLYPRLRDLWGIDLPSIAP